MTVTTRPRPLRSPAPPPGLDPLEALIEEARRRARRRRQRYAAAALLTALAATLMFFGVGRGGGGNRGQAASHPPLQVLPHIKPIRVAVVRNGPLTIADDPTSSWYGISTIGRSGSPLDVARCPHRVRWCGESQGVAWAPDGKWLAVSVTSVTMLNDYNGIHVVNPATGADRTALSCAPTACDWIDLAWSPDGSRLAYSAYGRIYVIAANGTRTLLRTHTAGRDTSPSWSPSGRWIAFANSVGKRSSIYAIRLDGTRRKLLATGASAPAWSPLGTTIAYRVGCGVKLITPTGRDVTPLSPLRCGQLGVSGPPVWSPDGRKLAVDGTTNYGTGTERGIFVMNADGSAVRQLTQTTGDYLWASPRPSWRPLARG